MLYFPAYRIQSKQFCLMSNVFIPTIWKSHYRMNNILEPLKCRINDFLLVKLYSLSGKRANLILIYEKKNSFILVIILKILLILYNWKYVDTWINRIWINWLNWTSGNSKNTFKYELSKHEMSYKSGIYIWWWNCPRAKFKLDILLFHM